jgi:hypothetical protein
MDRARNFPDRFISWEGGHALTRALERGKEPSEVERVIRSSPSVQRRQNGRYAIDGCIGGEVTRIIVTVARSDALVVVTVYGRGTPCS